MKFANINSHVMHFRDDGPRDGPVVMFSNSLGTDLRVWDPLIAALPDHLRIIRYDKRGHGLSELTKPPYFMGDLVKDAGGLLDHLSIKDVVFVGLSIGGLIGQGLAAERPGQIKGLVLSNTAAKIGNESTWGERIELIREHGLAGIADAVLERWFSKRFLSEETQALEIWRAMLTRTPQDGYVGCCEAIAHTDLIDSTARLRLPTMVIASSEDGATPPDLVRETADLIEGSQFHMIPKAGHIPCVERPDTVAALLTDFLTTHGLG